MFKELFKMEDFDYAVLIKTPLEFNKLLKSGVEKMNPKDNYNSLSNRGKRPYLKIKDNKIIGSFDSEKKSEYKDKIKD